jgi:hypothetical protein
MAAAAGGGLAAVTVLALAAVSLVPPHLTGDKYGGGGAPRRTYSVEVINTVFTDHQHGYAVEQRCSMDEPGDVPDGAPTPDVHQECASHLLVTADGGQS